MIEPDDFIRQHVVEVLNAAAEATGDGRYRVAVGVVKGARNGRPMRPDSDLLAQMQVMLDHGDADSVAQAARFVAASLDGEHSKRAAATRIARKFRHADNKNI